MENKESIAYVIIDSEWIFWIYTSQIGVLRWQRDFLSMYGDKEKILLQWDYTYIQWLNKNDSQLINNYDEVKLSEVTEPSLIY